MEVRKSRHVDCSEPDAEGFFDYHYEYDIYEFIEGDVCVVARSYTDEPHEAHFLSRAVAGKRFLLAMADLKRPLFRSAIGVLEQEGKTQIRYLDEKHSAYLPVG
jgi:hypothetical protein